MLTNHDMDFVNRKVAVSVALTIYKRCIIQATMQSNKSKTMIVMVRIAGRKTGVIEMTYKDDTLMTRTMIIL